MASGAFVRIPDYATCIKACALWLDKRLIAAKRLCVDDGALFQTLEIRLAPGGDYLAAAAHRSDADTSDFETRLGPNIRALFDRYRAFAGPWLTSFSGELIRTAAPSIPSCAGAPATDVSVVAANSAGQTTPGKNYIPVTERVILASRG